MNGRGHTESDARKRSLMQHFLAPTIWLSSRLAFSRKFLLIGAVVLIALALLSLPLLRQVRDDRRLAGVEREGLRQYVAQVDVLANMIALRSRGIDDKGTTPSSALNADMARLAAQASRAGMAGPAERLSRSWQQADSHAADPDLRRRFATMTASINALLALIEESARTYRLNVDPELDATFDMLTSRLPLVLETLGKQRDALALHTGEMASYALGAQVVLTESAPALKAGIAQMVAREGHRASLQRSLQTLLDGIVRQQDAADNALDDPKANDELGGLTHANLALAQLLLKDAVDAADQHLASRIDQLDRAQRIIAALLLGVIVAVAYLFAGIYLSTLRSLRSLSVGTDAFCGGQLETRIEVDTRDELVLVARNFNTMAAEVQRLLEFIRRQNESRQRELETLVQQRTAELADKNELLLAAGKRVQEELDLARGMQLAILPQSFPDEPGWGVCAGMFPARELSGDFYDCFALPDGRYGVLVADVSGKGVGAAFFMAVSRTVLLDLASTGSSPAEVFAHANTLLCERNPMELFVTACYAIYDPGDGSLVYASAGHHPPLLRKASGVVAALPSPSDIALGILHDMDYADHTAVLEPGDSLLLYTDGVTEAFSGTGEAYGDERLHAWLSATAPDATAGQLLNGLVRDVARFVDEAEASDDLTCLVLCRKQEGSMKKTPALELHDKVLLLEYPLLTRLEEIAKLAEAVERALIERPDLAFSANLCLEELITNTILHGLNGAPDRWIDVRLSMSDEWLEISLKDDAPQFDPFAEAPAPALDLDVEERPIGGLGVHMVKTMMNEARAYHDGSGNLIVLLKTLQQSEPRHPGHADDLDTTDPLHKENRK
ncbi:ATP-binding SpoIIE family protein phosphatase [Paraburkholderia lacunae]|uniref:HAMP domain-containing protein n=1 Tax=Paraburkholderia lacunae TaxID=2211104 RepID=A0A370NEX1_9BURK|nr:SpoIIE family protein phosphatase [Paraburkholderia lacunae]RDK04115.1 hypothetical protein DLM46_03845 [Paraburkholderia lacunae]